MTMGSTQNQTDKGNLLSVMLTPEDIKNGKFLLGRYDVDTENLTEIRIISSRANVPPANEHAAYKLIGVGEDGAVGQPLYDFVDEHVKGWDGITPITLFFKVNGAYDHWAPGATAAAGR